MESPPKMTDTLAIDDDDLLSLFLEEEGFTTSANRGIPVAVERNKLPLSFAQQRLWILDQLEPKSLTYVIPRVFKLEGKINLDLLEQSFNFILSRHEVLRTSFRLLSDNSDEQPVQIIEQDLLFKITQHDTRRYLESERQQKLQLLAARPFDLSQAPLMRVDVLTLSEDCIYLLLCIHHIVTDAVSNDVFLSEFVHAYHSLSLGQIPKLEPLQIQYADYAAWQREWLQGEVLDEQLNYWRGQLGEEHPILALPCDKTRLDSHEGVRGRVEFQLDDSLSSRISSYSAANGLTPYVVLLACFHLFLARYCQQDDIRIGVPVANRRRLEVESLIGFFVNTQVIRVLFSPDLTVAALVKNVQRLTVEAQNAQDLPFEYLVDALNPKRDLDIPPLFQVMFNYKRDELESSLTLPDLNISTLSLGVESGVKFDLLLEMCAVTDGGLYGSMEYSRALLEEDSVSEFTEAYQILLKGMMDQLDTPEPGKTVFDLQSLSQKTYQRVFVDWNVTQANFPQKQCIHEQFESQVARTPDEPAVSFEGQQLSYRELNESANQLARYLISQNKVKPDARVGVLLERSFEMVVSILAILKSGAAYVPLDPDYPDDRLGSMCEDAGLNCLITVNSLQSTALTLNALSTCPVLTLDDSLFTDKLLQESKGNIEVSDIDLNSQHLAYVIYTSGSTGKPKGVMISHDALVNRIDWMDKTYGAGVGDNFLQKTPFSFDVSVWEFVWPLVKGARLVMAKAGGHKDPEYLSHLIQSEKINKIHFVPSMLASMLSFGDLAACVSLKQVFCSGEALALSHAEGLFQRCPWIELHNLYGPTEAAIDVSYWSCAPIKKTGHGLTGIPIGKPIQNIQLYVFDKYLNPLAPGVIGELYIGGQGLARGYLNRPELTQEKFIDNPFYKKGDKNSSTRLYRTGDLVRWLANGNIDYVGRADFQVKLRGLRIELGEIETVLNHHESVAESIVVVNTTETGDQQLVAYVVPIQAELLTENSQDNRQHFIDAIRHHVACSLPEYMIPNGIMLLNVLPLSANGKVDRKALPSVSVAQCLVEYEAPRTETQKKLLALWCELLNVSEKNKEIGIHNNFFDMGGDSLMAIRLMGKVRECFDCDLALTSIFKAQTIAELSRFIEKGKDDSFSTLVELNNKTPLAQLFCFHPAGGNVNCYKPLANNLSSRAHIIGVQGRELISKNLALNSMDELAKDYANQILSVSHEGPFNLFGWCIGGHIALAVGHYLESLGKTVNWVGVVDYDARFQHTLGNDADDLFKDMMNFIREEGVSVPNETIDNIKPLLSEKSYEEGVDQLVELGFQSGYLKTDLTPEQFKLGILMSKKAHDLIKTSETQNVNAALTVWLSREKLSRRPEMKNDWREYSEQHVNIIEMAEDHYSMLSSKELHDSVLRIIS